MDRKKWFAFGMAYSTVLVLLLSLFGVFGAENAKRVMVILSDTFFVQAVVFGGIGIFMWIGTWGVYDMMGYAFNRLFARIRFEKDGEGPKDFYEYKMAKQEKGRSYSPELLILGALSLVLAFIFLIVYENL